MKKFKFIISGFLFMFFASDLGAQLFYAYPQTVFALRGVYSFRFMHTSFLFEDDLDRIFYPVKLSEIEGGRFFSALTNPFGNERLFDPTQPTNNQLILGAKTNFFANLSPLYMQTDFNTGISSKLDTTYYRNWNDSASKYEDKTALSDTIFYGRGFGEKGFLVSLGTQSFGFLFLYSNQSIRSYPQRTGVFPFGYGNYTYVKKTYDNLNDSLTNKDSATSYKVADTTITPILGAFSFGFGGFSGMVFVGFGGVGDRDTGNYYAESGLAAQADTFNGQKWSGSISSNAKASGPIFGFQTDLQFGSETWKSNLMFAYAGRFFSNGKGRANRVLDTARYQNTPNPTYRFIDSTISEYKYSSNIHNILIYLRNKYPVHEQVLFGVGLGLGFTFGGISREYTRVLTKNVTIYDDGNGSIDNPGDSRTTTWTESTYKENTSIMDINYYIPVGFELIPIASWEDVKLRLGALYSHISSSTTTKTYDWNVESKTKTETPSGTTETTNDIDVPGENITKSKATFSNTTFYYGASVAIAKRVIIDFTGFGNGLLAPAFWNVSVILKY